MEKVPSGEINQHYVKQGNIGGLKKYYTTREAANRQPHERLFTYPFTVITLCCWKVTWDDNNVTEIDGVFITVRRR